MRSALALALVCALSPPRAWAGGAGHEPFNFLFLDADARAAGLGGAYTAIAKDANALLYNPAGLARVGAHEASFMENRYAEGVSQEYVGYASPRGWGLNLNHLSFGEIPRTTVSNPDGTGSFGIRDLAVGAGYGRLLPAVPGLSLGAGVKLLRETVDDASASGFAADLGALWESPAVPGLAFGGAVQNMGPTVRFSAARENLPLYVRLGAAYSAASLGVPAMLAFDVMKERSESPLFAAGLELAPAGRALPLRLGYSSRNDAGTGIAIGLGWVSGMFHIDYAFVPLGELGSAHRLSLGLRWGAPEDAMMPELVTEIKPEEAPRVPVDEHFRRAEDRLRKSDFAEATRELQEVSVTLPEGDPRWIEYYVLLGRVFLLQKDYRMARAGFERAIRTARDLGLAGPQVAEAYLGLGRMLIEQGNLDYAEKFLGKALEAAPSEETRRAVSGALAEIETKRAAP
ncbi:PorV/PorQ family protein [bacterium]|nr:MAG: PorV/PorQ family protein [bacterium]